MDLRNNQKVFSGLDGEQSVGVLLGDSEVTFTAGTIPVRDWPGTQFDYAVTTRVRLGVARAGIEVERLVVTARRDGPPVTFSRLRRERPGVGELLHYAVRLQTIDDDAERAGNPKARADLAPHDGRAKRVEPSDIRRAATAYKRAQTKSQPTTAAVAEALGVTATTARKRIMQARAKGLLPASGGTTRPKL